MHFFSSSMAKVLRHAVWVHAEGPKLDPPVTATDLRGDLNLILSSFAVHSGMQQRKNNSFAVPILIIIIKIGIKVPKLLLK